MISMTGYGSSEEQHEDFTVSAELKSLNNRYLDIQLSTPSSLGFLEQEIRNAVKREVLRGRVEVNVRIRHNQTVCTYEVDTLAAARLRQALEEVAHAAGLDERPRLDHFIADEQVIRSVSAAEGEMYREPVLGTLEKALSQFQTARAADGSTTAADILQKVEQFTSSFESVRSRTDELEKRLQENLRERFRELVGENCDETRLLQEVAVLLNRYTVNEEIQRTASHLEQFRLIMRMEGAVGKRLDFLCQELNREINTIASKSTSAEVSQAVVSMKDALENIREQLRNIE
jgi:uncharacterized protein (TIGR00255 family)